MPVPVNLPPPPHSSKQDAEAATWMRWFQQVQAAVNALGGLRSYEVVNTPASGFGHQIPVNTGLCLILPAGALLAGGVTLPVNALDGFEQRILTSQTVTTLTVTPSAGQTIVGTAVFALAAGVEVIFRWRAETAVWYRML